MTTWRVRHPCGEIVERDEFDILDERHRSGACRGSAHHPLIPMPKSEPASLRGKKGTF